jgi:hypothetical protein
MQVPFTVHLHARATNTQAPQTPFSLNLAPILKFALFSIISSPPNIIWQTFLEDTFPTNVPASTAASEREKEKKTANGKPLTDSRTQLSKRKTELSKRNVFIKFLLDQTFGAVMNNLLFIAYMGYVNAPVEAKASAAVQHAVSEKFWPIMKDGYKLWPAVSLISFLFVPLDKRLLFGCLVGVGWNIYLSLLVG